MTSTIGRPFTIVVVPLAVAAEQAWPGKGDTVHIAAAFKKISAQSPVAGAQTPGACPLVVLIALLGLSLACEGRTAKQSVMRPADVAADQRTLDQLRAAGSDVSRTHTIEFYLHLPSQQDAKAAAATLQSEDFDTVVTPGKDGRRWLCLAQKEMVPTIDNLSEARRTFTDLATQYHGRYDGWKAAVLP